jgi:phosphoglycerate dehydrogenase-like enzyme
MSATFSIGITPDFYVDAKGRFETVIESELSPAPDVEFGPMPAQPGKIATPEALNLFDGIFCLGLRIQPESLVGVDRLAVVARWGVGYDKIDVPALTEAGILLAITPKAVRRPVAEAIITLVFALAKNLLVQDRTIRAGKWRGDLPGLGADLLGGVLGSIGCGNIAREMFRMAGALGFARLIAHDPYVKPELAEELGIELVDRETLFRESDYLAVNTPLTAETRGLVGETELRSMKPTACLINTARGPIVDEGALLIALKEGWIKAAGLDVFAQEPPAADHPLFSLDNVILAPHGLAWTEGLVRDNGIEACRNLLAVSRGELPGGIVNPQVLSRPGFQKKLRRFRHNGS